MNCSFSGGEYRECDVCYESRLGYKQLGDIMVCNNCGRQFPSVRINVEEGGCNPAPLERVEVDGLVVIHTSVIDTGIRFF
ncbi:MAG: Fe-S-containing protein [Spirochaetia bacterium]|nr:Fe-S-containing protein [Spirochaetia bacterium]